MQDELSGPGWEHVSVATIGDRQEMMPYRQGNSNKSNEKLKQRELVTITSIFVRK